MKITIRSIIGLILTLVIAYSSFDIISKSAVRKEMVLENAEVRNIKNGMLNVHSWKRKISEILAKKVEEFELTTENRQDLRKKIDRSLRKMIKEINRIMNKKRSSGSLLSRFKATAESFVLDMTDLEDRVPEFTNIILEELDKKETRENLKDFILAKIDKFLYEKVGEEDLSALSIIEKKYDCEGIDGCGGILERKLSVINGQLLTNGFVAIGLSILVFLLIFIANKNITRLELTILVLVCGILLYAGVSTPMIDIDARIQKFTFILMGESITFENQILFFQSKSIFDVVNILISTGKFQSMLVGGLILLFSIIFPIAKLIASLLLLFKSSLRNNGFINFLALKSGKWSMADVFVVAIFMAFIGFRGVIESQLKQLETIGDKVEIFTTDNSDFGVGFILFLSFSIAGLFMASMIGRQIKSEESN